MTDIKILDEKPFHILLIEPGKIMQLDWNNPDYIQTLVNMPFVKTMLVEPSKFFEKIYELLKINKDDEHKHLMTESIGHKQEFWENFKFLLENAKEIGVYNPIDYKKKPQEYCGMKITDNPFFDN